MKKGLMLALLGAAAFVIFLVITAPATLLASIVQRAAPVELQGVSGSMWRGSAQRVVAPELALGPLNWRLHGWPLLLGKVRLNIEIPDGAPHLSGKAEITASVTKKLSLSDVDLQADAAWVLTQAALPLAADGRFHLQIRSAELREGALPRIEGQLEWRDARVVYPQTYTLGAYRMTLRHHPETDPEFLLGEIKDIDSAFKIDGTLKVDRQGDYELTARLAAAPNAPQIFRDTLLFLGEPAADGSVQIERNGNAFEDYRL